MQPWRNRQPVANHGQRGIDRRIFKYHLCHDTCFAKTPENGVAKGAIRRQEAQSQWAPCLSSEPYGFQQLCKYVLEDGEPYAEPQVEDTLRWLRQSFQGHKAVGIISSGIR